jgi:hypothetical protein
VKSRALPELPPDVLADPHLSRLRQPLHTRRHVDTVAVHVPVRRCHDVADVDADPERVLPHAGRCDPRGEVVPHPECRPHRRVGAWELRQHGVAQELHDPAVVPLGLRSGRGLKKIDQPHRGVFVARR